MFKVSNREVTGMELEIEMAEAEYNHARTAFYRAQENFDNAEAGFIDIACREMGIAEDRMDNALKKLKALKDQAKGVGA